MDRYCIHETLWDGSHWRVRDFTADTLRVDGKRLAKLYGPPDMMTLWAVSLGKNHWLKAHPVGELCFWPIEGALPMEARPAQQATARAASEGTE